MNGLNVDVGLIRAASVEVAALPDNVVFYKASELGNLDLALKSPENLFEVRNVTIGRDFHWQKNETQIFRGEIILKCDGRMIQVVNRVPVETYLESVVSSEMNPDAPLELLKAHAVISRTWLMARIKPYSVYRYDTPIGQRDDGKIDNDRVRIIWYDTDQHFGFHVCADDHCQRYQGVTRIANQNAVVAVKETAGQILTYDGKICDARFSKCCGGTMELFESCWQPVNHPYLQGKRDRIGTSGDFCDTSDISVLRRVLNDYDLSTEGIYRWRVEYTQEELSSVIRSRSGLDFGEIIDIQPVERGVSGRLVRVRIVGTRRVMTVGKELEIRRWLSKSHLYSSAFEIERKFDDSGDGIGGHLIPKRFILSGKGWGHGVGLCQIGAAMMAMQGYGYREILHHYYPGAVLNESADC